MKSTHENGRTLLEMIGVISLIAALTMGSLKVYNGMIENYKINKVARSLVNAATNIKKLYSWQRDYSEITNKGTALNDFLCKEKIFTEECRGSGATTLLIHDFGGKIAVAALTDGFSISYEGLTSEQCFKVARQNIGFFGIKVRDQEFDNPTLENIQTACTSQATAQETCSVVGGSTVCKTQTAPVLFKFN